MFAIVVFHSSSNLTEIAYGTEEQVDYAINYMDPFAEHFSKYTFETTDAVRTAVFNVMANIEACKLINLEKSSSSE
ncbi:hypothetical protein ABGV42_02105 [Paenibacillus pabuli]|uniref:hypothetical protein n=1 Tax=Paenibacillus pabuli TaxID=1472 RepID=UPI003241CE78